jgi:hypothetical protein
MPAWAGLLLHLERRAAMSQGHTQFTTALSGRCTGSDERNMLFLFAAAWIDVSMAISHTQFVCRNRF